MAFVQMHAYNKALKADLFKLSSFLSLSKNPPTSINHLAQRYAFKGVFK